mmetsp:Transcript_27585/g.67097  ORF Transcript_27585/g.67097 Transcript_27585/m.67097 type:complete len:819 (+) Transcript_27585:229-2685(+)
MKGIIVRIITLSLIAKEVAALSYSTCDSDSIPASTKASNLVPNQFHKLCPGVPNSAVGGLKHPICGDGTPFSFFFAKPTQRKMNTAKLLIEFMGGGACWDADTCGQQQSYLTFPSKLDNFVSKSCSEIHAGQGDLQFNMLCAQTNVGSVDFTTYNTLIVPYCTQDVHVGSQSVTYEDGSTINHVGGANTMAAMEWVFENFPNPSHIVLTGCSAGGTALPIAYDMLNMHYNRWTRSPPGMRSVQISALADSSVYLTPTYFLQNAFGNWGPGPIMKKLSFPFNKYKDSENYSTEVWNHVLKRGPNSDQWGFITYNNDPISQMYYSYMGGMYADDDGYNGRQLEEDVSDAWWSSLSGSLAYVQKRHKNVQTFIMDGEGHCTFGWYYAIQQDGFDDWIKSIIKEKPVFGRTSSATPLFAVAAILGGLVALGAMNSRKKRDIGVDDGVLLNEGETRRSSSQLLHSTFSKFSGFCTRFSDYPITAGYFAIVTIYFVTMLISQGFAHPVNNPSLGPSANSLSSFGINNPSLIVYNSQLIRLITSGFLCSGVLTFAILAFTLHRHTRNLEKEIGSSKEFCILALAVMLGSNLIYACVAGGASCATIATILGMNTLSIVLPRNTPASETPASPKPICSTITIFILAALVLPFNSWIINLSSICIGLFLGYAVAERQAQEVESDLGTGHSLYTAKRNPLKGFCAFCLVLLLLLACRAIRPNRLYTSPFLTGCDLTYVELPSDIVGSFYDNRRLEAAGDEGDTICAEFCVPHIAGRPLVWGASTYSGYAVSSGQCQDKGYDTHIADKTFSKATYSVDVEVYTTSNNGYN